MIRRTLGPAATRQPANDWWHDGSIVEPVQLGASSALDAGALDELCTRYHKSGFAVFETSDDPSSEATMMALTEAVGLGEPFVPEMYRLPGTRSLYGASGLNAISVGDGGDSHPAFRACSAQPFHCDGTLEEIGFVKSSMLICIAAAETGGETRVFDAVGAFAVLEREDPAAAQSLTSDCLKRVGTVGLVGAMHVGPAFARRDGECLSRYSVTSTDSWVVPNDVCPDDLRAGIDWMETASAWGSSHTVSLRLEERQGILFANDKVAHARGAYTDGPSSVRRLLRGLYRTRPFPPSIDARRIAERGRPEDA